MIRRTAPSVVVLIALVLLAGCGGSDATPKQRIDGCLDKQPDATKAECEQWEEDGELGDDGTHEGHEG